LSLFSFANVTLLYNGVIRFKAYINVDIFCVMTLSKHICRHCGHPFSSIVTISAWSLYHGLTNDTYVSSASTKSSLYLQCSATLYRVRPIDYLGICISRQQTAGGLWPITKIIFNGCSRAYKVHVYNVMPLNGSPVFVQASRNSKNTN
jgi:hypothetical protein